MIARFVPLPLVCALALTRTLTASGPTPKPPANESLKRQAFQDLRTHERDLRRKAANDFPTDPWSQDDAFHAYEAERARSFADKHEMSLTDVFDALDSGMRSLRVRGDRSMTASVPPCHPRPIY
jgi:hypothetical protein